LGLTNVKNLVEDAGGKISVDSIEGKGTIFKVMLPATVVFDIGG
jgi:chemotaxis protein histidine kinase CheA